MRAIFLFVLSICFLFLSAAFGTSAYEYVFAQTFDPKVFSFAGWGVLGFFILRIVLLFLNRNLDFFDTFCHELNHTLFALLSFYKIESFFAHAEKGGNVTFRGEANPVIALAPYSFPLFAFFTALLSLILIPQARTVAQVLVGFFLAFHVGSVLRNARPRQTDLRLYGYLFSYSAVIFFNLFWIPFVLLMSVFGIDGGLGWCKSGLSVAADRIFSLWRLVCSAWV